MHINHRRKNICRAKHHNERWPMLIDSARIYRQVRNREARRQTRHLIAVGRFDDIPRKYPKTVLYDYW